MQLKHSSKHAHDPWKASGLKGTIEGFAGRFNKLEASLGLDVLEKKVRFVFLTNRPIAADVLEALADLAAGATELRHPAIDKLLKRYAASAGTKPVRQRVDDGENPFDAWLRGHLLTRTDSPLGVRGHRVCTANGMSVESAAARALWQRQCGAPEVHGLV